MRFSALTLVAVVATISSCGARCTLYCQRGAVMTLSTSVDPAKSMRVEVCIDANCETADLDAPPADSAFRTTANQTITFRGESNELSYFPQVALGAGAHRLTVRVAQDGNELLNEERSITLTNNAPADNCSCDPGQIARVTF